MENSIVDKLKSALDLVDDLKNENKYLRDNFDKVIFDNEINMDMQVLVDKHERISKEFNTICKEKDAIEVEYEEFKEKSKQKLLQKEVEFEEIMKKPPLQKEVELMKLQIREDVESKTREKCLLLEKESNKFKNLYYKIRREWDSSENEFETKKTEILRSKQEMERMHEIEISNLNSKIKILQALTEEVSEVERLRQTQREKVELELRVRSLLAELDEVRAEKEEMRISMEKEDRIHKRQLTDQIAASKGFHSEKESLQSKCHILEEELRTANRKKEELLQDNTRIKKELDRITNRLEENAHQFKVELCDAKAETLKERNNSQNEIEDFKSKLSNFKNEIKGLKLENQELQGKIATLDREYLDKLRLAREEDWSKIAEAEAEKHDIEKKLARLQQNTAETEIRNESLIKEYFVEMDRLKKDNSEYALKIEQLKTDLQNITIDKEQQILAYEQARQKADETMMHLQDSTHSLDRIKTQLNHESEKVKSLEDKVKEQDQQILFFKDQLARETEAFEHTLERQHLKNSQEKQRLNQNIEEMMKERLGFMERIEATEEILERQQTLFQSKINILKEKSRLFKDELGQTKKLLEMEQLKNEQKQEELRKRQSGFLEYLNTIQV